ncbi:hypothetical protein [Portibacter marinus]|uniref:hypothetical protein n=1 Tax=Portibacter marinus TaxID=2898660 RepID=UPI001F2A195F|nr:hypothetical protein [Portibacter marinus]
MRLDSTTSLLKRWRNREVAMALSGILLIWILAYFLIGGIEILWLMIAVPMLGSLLILIFLYKNWPKNQQVVTFLHQKYPTLEYSLSLLDRPDVSLNDLERLQKNIVQQRLNSIDTGIPSGKRLLTRLASIVLLSFLLMFTLPYVHGQKSKVESNKEKTKTLVSTIDPKQDSAYLEDMRLLVSPPAYTGLPTYVNKDLQGTVAEGSQLMWKYDIQGPVEVVELYYGEDERTPIKSIKALNSAVYYYAFNDSAGRRTQSPYYSISVKEDQKPEVGISGIEEYQKFPWKDNYDIHFNIKINDEYGVEDAFLSATVADGEGEAVKFREKTFPLKNLSESTFSFSTKALEMEPGSELYFYVMAKDNCPFRIQVTKSSTYFIVLEDTTTRDYMDQSGMQVDLMPDFFRSQRQIIIDTEKLIAEKGQISRQEFKQRSNELGYDQKLLRLKYGQFLGEEAESGIVIENEVEANHDDQDHDHDHDHGDGDVAGQVNVLEEYGHDHDHEAEEGMLLEENGTRNEDPARPDWVQELSHNHDNTEVNTYFEISLKSKLKAALSVMWDSELQLRLYQPKESLPYQYEALEYLQEIKNHARVYVHRIGFDPPVIKEKEKRLSGDLEEVVSAENERNFNTEEQLDKIQEAIQIVSERTDQQLEFQEPELKVLEEAGQVMARMAIEQIDLLKGLSLLREIINKKAFENKLEAERLLRYFLRTLPEESSNVVPARPVIHPINKAAIEAL